MRGPIATAAFLLLAQTASAALLCRDGKGLFTPCPHGANRTARAILSSAPARETAVAKEPARAAAPLRSTLASAPTRKRLCTDSKGLFTPCAR